MKHPRKYEHSAQTRQLLSSNLGVFDSQRQPAADLKHAAVVLAVTRHGGDAAIIVTRRTHSLRAHTGQWALPGGRIDPGESAVEAALREMHEEINLVLTSSEVLGTLDDYVTRSGYLITPVVVWNDTPWSELVPNPDEVASIAAFSFAELSRSDSPLLTDMVESDRQVLSMHFQGDVIYAPTGALLYQFREVAMQGRPTRVLHYDQPRFAWR